jgi:type 1 glutamine amidotransferase
MPLDLNRRQWLAAAGSAWLGAGAIQSLQARPAAPVKKVLFFSKSAGYQHSVITQKAGAPSVAQTVLESIGEKHGFEVESSKDGRLFDPKLIGKWDAFVFETTGDLTTPGTDRHPPLTADGEKALYDAIHAGKGFIGMHCATDTFGHHGERNKGADDPYIQLIGGEFYSHAAQQEVEIEIVDPKFPGVAEGFGASGSSFRIKDEWYALKSLADDLHVIFAHNTKGMVGREYQRPNFPETWARAFGKGRVFYTSMGHREDVFENAMFQALLLGALGWATGRLDADITPNVSKATPGYKQLPAYLTAK